MSTISVHCKRADGARVTFDDVDASTYTVHELKRAIAAQEETTIGDDDDDGRAVSSLRLIYKGRVMKDACALSEYGVVDQCVIHVVRAATTGAVARTTTEATQAASPAPAASPADAFSRVNQQPFAHHQSPEDEARMMREMMSNPFIRGQLESMFSDPEAMRQMIEENPALAGALEANPHLREVLRDPETMRQMLNVATNPSLMQEAMRSNDRAMSNISSHPDGFNALRRMYESTASAMDGVGGMDSLGGGGQDDANERRRAAAPADGPLPNPWGGAAAAVPPPGGGIFGGGALGDALTGVGAGMGAPGASASDMERIAAAIDNPQMQQAMSSMLSNPQAMEAMINLNPQMRHMMDANPHVREMLQNPEALRAMLNPENLRAMAQMQQAMRTLGGDGGLAGMFGGAPAPPQGPPEEVYASQLSQLNDMGFFDTQENIRALRATGGNVHAAVDRLLSGGAF